jgi:hypothetical protein
MNCCGEPAKKDSGANRSAPYNAQPRSQQPGFIPGPQVQQTPFQQPSITSPAPAHQFNNGYAQDGFQQPGQTWGHTPSALPPGNQLSPYASLPGTSSPNASGTIYDGSTHSYNTTGNQPLMRPPSALRSENTSPRPMPIPQSPNFAPPSDEGKMSVSIDFGASTLLVYFIDIWSHS